MDEERLRFSGSFSLVGVSSLQRYDSRWLDDEKGENLLQLCQRVLVFGHQAASEVTLNKTKSSAIRSGTTLLYIVQPCVAAVRPITVIIARYVCN